MAKKLKKIEAEGMFDKNRALQMERIQSHGNNKYGLYYIKVHNTVTNLLFELKALTIQDIRKMASMAEDLERMYNEQ